MLIRHAEVGGEPCSVRIASGRIAALAPTLELAPGERVLDAAGGALLPGLHDHHIHLFSLAAARASRAVRVQTIGITYAARLPTLFMNDRREGNCDSALASRDSLSF